MYFEFSSDDEDNLAFFDSLANIEMEHAAQKADAEQNTDTVMQDVADTVMQDVAENNAENDAMEVQEQQNATPAADAARPNSAASSPTWRMPDIEDFGVATDYVEQYKKGKLSATDLAQGVKCQQKVALQCITGIREHTTASMRHGTAVHDRLEAEALPEGVEEIPITTPEDVFAGMLMDTLQKLKWIRQYGRAREIRCVAKIKGVWVIGIVDEVCWDENTNTAIVIDDKTRRHKSRPSEHLAAAYKLQVMLYRFMLLMMQTLTADDLLQLAELRGVSTTTPLSPETQAALGYNAGPQGAPGAPSPHAASAQGPLDQSAGPQEAPGGPCQVVTSSQGPPGALDQPAGPQGGPGGPLTVAMVAQQFVLESAGLWPALSEEVQIKYRVGNGEEVWDTDSIQYDLDWLDKALTTELLFWKGSKAPKMTRFKGMCYNCTFWRECPVGSKRYGNDALLKGTPMGMVLPKKRGINGENGNAGNGNDLGNVAGNAAGKVHGNVPGPLHGNVSSDFSRNVVEDAVGNAAGNLHGNVVGNLHGNVSGNTGVVSRRNSRDQQWFSGPLPPAAKQQFQPQFSQHAGYASHSKKHRSSAQKGSTYPHRGGSSSVQKGANRAGQQQQQWFTGPFEKQNVEQQGTDAKQRVQKRATSPLAPSSQNNR